jgi:hypothetical protein
MSPKIAEAPEIEAIFLLFHRKSKRRINYILGFHIFISIFDIQVIERYLELQYDDEDAENHN